MRQASSLSAVITVVITTVSLGMLLGSSVASVVLTPARSVVASAQDFPDDPVSVAVDADGDVLVGLSTDVNFGVVRRFSATGELRSATAWSGALQARPYVAEGPSGMTLVGQIAAEEIALVDAAGVVGRRWAVSFPQRLRQRTGGILAAGPLAGPEAAGVFALAETRDGPRVIRFAPDGREVARWTVGASAYDLAVGRTAAGDLRVFVVESGPFGGSTRVVTHRTDGTVEDDRVVDGDILGFDTAPSGQPRQIVRPELSPTAFLDARNGPPIAGSPSDLAVAPNGDVFAVTNLGATGRDPGVVLHYTATGCLIETWPNALLNGGVDAVPTPGPLPCPRQDATPTPDEPPTATPSPSATWTPGGPPSITPTPSSTPRPTTTPTRTPWFPIDFGPIYLPFAADERRLRTDQPAPSDTPIAPPTRDARTPMSTRVPAPSPTPGASPTSADHGAVVLQVQDGGGFLPTLYWEVEKTPWFTLYADGTYVRAGGAAAFEWWTGRLASEERDARVARLAQDEPIFASLRQGALCQVCLCPTDGPTTRVFVRSGDRGMRTSGYLMTSLGHLTGSCSRPPGPRPTPVDAQRLLDFARAIVALEGVSAAGETAFVPQHTTVFAEPSESDWGTTVGWPLDRPVRECLGRDALTADQVAAVIRAARITGQPDRIVRFHDADGLWDVGLRVEPPGWTTYCEGEPGCPAP